MDERLSRCSSKALGYTTLGIRYTFGSRRYDGSATDLPQDKVTLKMSSFYWPNIVVKGSLSSRCCICISNTFHSFFESMPMSEKSHNRGLCGSMGLRRCLNKRLRYTYLRLYYMRDSPYVSGRGLFKIQVDTKMAEELVGFKAFSSAFTLTTAAAAAELVNSCAATAITTITVSEVVTRAETATKLLPF